MDFYKDWETFISNMDCVPEYLDGEKLIKMTTELSLTREERCLLGNKVSKGDYISLESFINAYIPLIVDRMKADSSDLAYNRDLLMRCIERIRRMVARNLYNDNLEEYITNSMDWIYEKEKKDYIDEMERIAKKLLDNKEKVRSLLSSVEMINNINRFISDEENAQMIKRLILSCKSEKERQMLGFFYGLEDGTPKTVQETADLFGISRERAWNLIRRAIKRDCGHLSRRKKITDFLED